MVDSDDVLPVGLPETDRARWAGMTVSQRLKARDRLTAIQAWIDGELKIEAATAYAGLSKSRFYRLAADWRAHQSLVSLGALTGSGAARSRLDPLAVETLQGAISNVVARNAGSSVSHLVRLLIEYAGVKESHLPGTIRMRNIVEEELRKVAAVGEAGSAMRLDCSAINLPRANGRPFILFVCIDVGTRLILGAAIGEEPVTDGYRAAAADAKKRLGDFMTTLPWAHRLARVEITSGVDEEASWDLVSKLKDGGVNATVQVSRIPRRFGTYFRKTVGSRIGRIAITPEKTTRGSAMPDNYDMSAWSHSDATAALIAAVDAYNMNISLSLPPPFGRAPNDLMRMLEIVGGQEATHPKTPRKTFML